MNVQTGDNVLIGGFIVTGSEPKKVIFRAIGPSLPLAGVLANPTLELHDGSGTIASNDNWMDALNKQEIIDSTIPPTDDLESAILMTLPATLRLHGDCARGEQHDRHRIWWRLTISISRLIPSSRISVRADLSRRGATS